MHHFLMVALEIYQICTTNSKHTQKSRQSEVMAEQKLEMGYLIRHQAKMMPLKASISLRMMIS
jgi:hypothetical protein